MRQVAFLAVVAVVAVVAWRYGTDVLPGGDGASSGKGDDLAVDRTEPEPNRYGIGTVDEPSLVDESVDALDVEDPFVVHWVAPESRTVRVADDDYSAVFDVVDRDGAVVVRPAAGAFARGDAPDAWFADAATALEDVLPDRMDAFADVAERWVADDDVLTAADVREHYECTHVRDIGRGHVVAVQGGRRRAELVVDDGTAAFTSPIDRNRYPDHWARPARLAAEVHVQEHVVDDTASDRDDRPRATDRDRRE